MSRTNPSPSGLGPLSWSFSVGLGAPVLNPIPTVRQPRRRRTSKRDQLEPGILRFLAEKPGAKGVSIARHLKEDFGATMREVLASMRREGILEPINRKKPGYWLSVEGWRRHAELPRT